MRRTRLAGISLLLATTTACESLLEVEIPGRVPATSLDNPALANTLVLGAQADFECAWSEYILAESLFTDEYIVASSSIGVTQVDTRNAIFRGAGSATCTTNRGRRGTAPYLPVQTARFQAEDVYKRITGFEGVADKEAKLARLALYAGYTYTLLGEGYCDQTVAIDGGPRRTKVSLWQDAEKWFNTAIGHAAALNDVRSAATLGRARARLNLGNGAGAVSDAQAIPEDFTYNVIRDATVPSRDNQIYQQNVLNQHVSVDPLFRGLTIDAQGNATQNNGVPDPRVVVRDGGGQKGEDGFTSMFYQDKFRSLSAPFSLASWREAMLIIAEVQGGQTAVDNINKLRNKRGLPRFASNDPVAIKKAVIEEKRREFFSEGHRISEMQRHDLPWQQGVNHRGLTYGTFECFPEFFVESDNNPNF